VFIRATFNGSAWFPGVTFSEGTNFYNTTFNKYASFLGAGFGRGAEFEQVIFNEDAVFLGTRFIGIARFRSAEFNGTADFVGAEFHTDAEFGEATFSRNVYFQGALFMGSLFMRARFEGLAVFDRTVFQRDTTRSSNLAQLVDRETNPEIPVTRFDGAIVGQNAEVRFIQPREQKEGKMRNFAIDRVSFLNVDLERFNFQDVEWGTYEGRRVVIEEVLMGKPPFEDVTPEKVRQIYARIRTNQEKALRYAEAGDFFVGEMEVRRKALEDRGSRVWPERFALWVFKWLSYYGESIFRPSSAALTAIVFFMGLRLVLNEPSEICVTEPVSWQESTWRSLAAFFQLRSSNLWTDIAERLISIPILGTLFIALKRRLERRS
jgi:uncharacterized protein YjbI with pentapeptide repeats